MRTSTCPCWPCWAHALMTLLAMLRSPEFLSCTRRMRLMGPYSSNSRFSLRSVTSYDRRDTNSVLKGSPCRMDVALHM